jgi:retron-type reverse transcriptase
MEAVEERICDQPVLKLLRAGVMEDGQVRRSEAGTPQGGVVSPLMGGKLRVLFLARCPRARRCSAPATGSGN